MVETGITRRIDELGRVVIPIEIRRNMRLREGEEVEIFMEDNRVILKKYSGVRKIDGIAQDVANSLKDVVGGTVLVTDLDCIIAESNANGRIYLNEPILKRVTKLFYERITRTLIGADCVPIIMGDLLNYHAEIFAPIIVGGDLFGGVIYLGDSDNIFNKVQLVEMSSTVIKNILQ